ncbi:NHL repeat-containing protein [candidate division KSB1 bacterium]
MNRGRLILFLGLTLILFNCTFAPETFTVETIDGVRHVHNIAPKWGDEQKISLEFVHKIGELESDDEDIIFYNPNDIGIDDDGNYYVLDTGNYRVVKFDKNLNHLLTFGSKGQGPGEFLFPRNIHIDATGNIFVNDFRNKRISVFDKEGNYKKTIKENFNPHTMRMLSSGEIAIYDISPAGAENVDKSGLISILDHDGNIIRRIGKRRIYEESIMNLQGNVVTFALDNRDNIYITYIVRNRIDKYSPEGKFLMQISRELPYPEDDTIIQGKLINSFSNGIQVDGKGRIWVGTPRVQLGEDIPAGESSYWLEIYDNNGVLLERLQNENYNYGCYMKITDDRMFIIETDKEMAVFEYRIVER